MAYISVIRCVSRKLGLPVDHFTYFECERAERSILRRVGPSATQSLPCRKQMNREHRKVQWALRTRFSSLSGGYFGRSKRQRSCVRTFLLTRCDAESPSFYRVRSMICKGREHNAPTGAPALPLPTPHVLFTPWSVSEIASLPSLRSCTFPVLGCLCSLQSRVLSAPKQPRWPLSKRLRCDCKSQPSLSSATDSFADSWRVFGAQALAAAGCFQRSSQIWVLVWLRRLPISRSPWAALSLWTTLHDP